MTKDDDKDAKSKPENMILKTAPKPPKSLEEGMLIRKIGRPPQDGDQPKKRGGKQYPSKYSPPTRYFQAYFQMEKRTGHKKRLIRDFRDMLIAQNGLFPNEPIPSMVTLSKWQTDYQWDKQCELQESAINAVIKKVWNVTAECLNFDIKNSMQSSARNILACVVKVTEHITDNPSNTTVRDIEILANVALKLLSKSEEFEVNHQLAKEQLVGGMKEEEMQASMFDMITKTGIAENGLKAMLEKAMPRGNG